MCCRLNTLAAFIAVLLGMSFCLDRCNEAIAETPAEKAANASATRSAEVEAQLDAITAKVEYVNTALKDVLADLSDKLKADIFLLRSSEADVNVPITLKVKEKAVSIRTILELVLDQVDDPLTVNDEVSYTIRDGVVLITKRYDAFSTQVYDCRDLLAAAKKRNPPGPDPLQAVLDKVADAVRADVKGEAKDPKAGATLMMLMMQLRGMQHSRLSDRHSQDLMLTIQQTVRPETWEATGGPGTLDTFNGLIAVKQSPQVHFEVQQLLNLLRAAEPDLPKNK